MLKGTDGLKNTLAKLNMEQRGLLLSALVGIDVELDPMTALVLSIVQEDEKKKADISAKRREAGRKGGIARQAKFTKPTLMEVNRYIQENKLNVKPDKFFNYYEERSWTVNGHGIDWKQRCNDWHKSERPAKVVNQKEGFSSYQGREIDYEALEARLLGY